MLQFANPSALWLLTLILPLVLLYLLKQKRRDYIVPSILLWKQAIEDVRAHSPFQKLRSSLLLLLQILILVIATAILSEPYALESPRESGRWILILDTSASMQATDVLPSRFHEAKKKLIESVETIPDTDEALLMTFSSDATIVNSFSKDHAILQSRLQDIQAEDVPGDWSKLPGILEPLLKQRPRPKIILASDFANYPADLSKSFPVETIAVGKESGNIAISQVFLRPVEENLKEQMLLIQITNHSGNAISTGIELRRNEDLIDAFDISLSPGETKEWTRTVQVLEESMILARVTTNDLLPLDNEFALVATPRSKIDVRMTLQNPYLLRALQALPSVKISNNNSASIEISSPDHDPQRPGLFFLRGENPKTSEMIQWNKTHPVLRFVDPGLWRFKNGRNLTTPLNGEAILESEEGVVGYVAGSPKERRVILGFALQESNLGLFAGFPVFLSNSLEWIHEGLEPELSTITGPEHPREGIYVEHQRKGYANFADLHESNISPQKIVGSAGQDREVKPLKKEFSSWLLFALAGFVMLEWYVFHKKYDA